MVTIFANISQTHAPNYITVDKALERIRVGKSMELCSRIRQETTKEARNELKKGLPSVCFGGEFSSRSVDGLIKPSGFMVLDFDGFDTLEDLQRCRFDIETDDYTYACFISPSGDGLKVVVKIPDADKLTYKRYFKAMEEYYNMKEFDKSCSDISRVTYESHDPNVFINTSSEVWIKMSADEPKQAERKVIIPTDDSNKIIKGILSWWQKNYGLVSGSRNQNMFILAAALNEYGIDKQEAIATCLKFEQPDFKATEITTTANSAYKNVSEFNTKVWEDMDAVKQVESLVSQSVPASVIREIVPNASDDSIEQVMKNVSDIDFWTYHPKTGEVQFVNHRYREFLVANGFYKYYASKNGTFVLVHLNGNVLREVLPEHIKDFVIDHLYEMEDKRPFNGYSEKIKMQKEDFLSFLPNINTRFMRDDRFTSYVYYSNCVVQLTSDAVTTLEYDDMNGIVWEKNIVNRPFMRHDHTGSEFEKLIRNISGNDNKRFDTMRSTIGYMLHRYNNPAENPAVVLNDETISDKPEGGTGKGIFVNGLSKIRKTEYIDGKSFDPKDKFAYQRVTIDTQVIGFQDVLKTFDFELLFSKLTDGMPVEVKYQGQMYIPFDDIPKMIITTNHAIKGDGNSHSRRKWEVEFTKYYSKEFTPFNEFGHNLFDDWDDIEWLRFDNFMLECIQLFLKKGLIKSDFKNLSVRKLEVSTSSEFREWVLGTDKKFPLVAGIEYSGPDLMIDFTDNYPDFRAGGPMRFNNRKFYQWLDEYAQYKYGTKLIEGRNSLGKTVRFYEPERQQKIEFSSAIQGVGQ
jgi:hypothetical protein